MSVIFLGWLSLHSTRLGAQAPFYYFEKVMEILIYSCFLATVLILWLNTEVVYEYSNLFNIGLFKPSEYKQWKKSNIEDDYIGYLMTNFHNNFFIRLICCPYCLGFWLSIFLGAISSNFMFFAPIYIFGLTMFFIVCKLSRWKVLMITISIMNFLTKIRNYW
jgi:hypothetical protein